MKYTIKILSIAIVSSTAIFSMSEEDTVGNTTNHAIVAPVAINRELAANIEAFLAANPNGTPSMANLAAFAEGQENEALQLGSHPNAALHTTVHTIVRSNNLSDDLGVLEAFLEANPNGTPSMANLAAFAEARNNGVDLAAPAHVASETQSG